MSDTHIISNTNIITRQLVAENQRTNVTADLFGVYFPIQLEPFIFSMSSQLSEDYSGGYWEFYKLGNGGFYMVRRIVTACSRWLARTAGRDSCPPMPSGLRSAYSRIAT